jgi:hypothetical protein
VAKERKRDGTGGCRQFGRESGRIRPRLKEILWGMLILN